MNPELIKQLKDAGFPHHWEPQCSHCGIETERPELIPGPTLSELIEACGDEFAYLEKRNNTWKAMMYPFNDKDLGGMHKKGQTPEEAVANLYIATHRKLSTENA